MREARAPVERRSAPRHRAVAPVRFPGGTGVTRDLSTTGLFFRTDDGSFELGQLVELSVTLGHADPEGPLEMICRGRVCRVEQPKPGRAGATSVGVAVEASELGFAAWPGQGWPDQLSAWAHTCAPAIERGTGQI
jgi:hypothetical protein